MQNQTQTKINSILIDGATGYVGSHLTHTLMNSNMEKNNVRCLVRKEARKLDISVLEAFGAKVCRADLGSNDSESVFSGVEIACHLIGSIAPRRGETSAELHVGQTQHFVQQCLKNKVKKIVMVSACGADAHAQSEYHRTKWQAEQIILQSGIPSIILRPSLIIGRCAGIRNSKLLARLEELIRTKKFVPLIGGGYNKLQPIFIQDLINAILAACTLESTVAADSLIMELGGPEVLTLRELADHMMTKISISKPVINLPVPVAMAIAGTAQIVQKVPIISIDQVKMSQQDNVCVNNKLNTLIGRDGTFVDKALDSYQWSISS